MELLRIKLQAGPAANRHLVELGTIWCGAEARHFARLGAVAAADRLVVALDLRIYVFSDDILELGSLSVARNVGGGDDRRLCRWNRHQAFQLNDQSLG